MTIAGFDSEGVREVEDLGDTAARGHEEFVRLKALEITRGVLLISDGKCKRCGKPVEARRLKSFPKAAFCTKCYENYGTCRDCDQQIEKNRMDAHPLAVRCIICEEIHETQNSKDKHCFRGNGRKK